MVGIGELISEPVGGSRPAVAFAVRALQAKLTDQAPTWGEVEQTLSTIPFGKRAGVPSPTADVSPARGVEPDIMPAYVSPGSPFYQFITQGGKPEIVEFLATTPITEISAMPGPGIALPGIGEIKMPDIFGGIRDVGKYALIGVAAIAGVILLSSFLKGRKK